MLMGLLPNINLVWGVKVLIELEGIVYLIFQPVSIFVSIYNDYFCSQYGVYGHVWDLLNLQV